MKTVGGNGLHAFAMVPRGAAGGNANDPALTGGGSAGYNEMLRRRLRIAPGTGKVAAAACRVALVVVRVHPDDHQRNGASRGRPFPVPGAIRNRLAKHFIVAGAAAAGERRIVGIAARGAARNHGEGMQPVTTDCY